VSHPAFRGLRPVFDFGEKFRLDPDALVRDPLGVEVASYGSAASTESRSCCQKPIGRLGPTSRLQPSYPRGTGRVARLRSDGDCDRGGLGGVTAARHRRHRRHHLVDDPDTACAAGALRAVQAGRDSDGCS
jgi:hypothetical protein